jgi:hypothetical protein
MSDIIDRLALHAFMAGKIESGMDLLFEDCLAEILRLRVENEKLRELVKAAYYEAYRHRHMAGDGGTDDPEDICAWRLSAAAAAIRESEG